MVQSSLSDPLHSRSSPDSHWSTTNVGEAMPGVLTPLGWTVWSRGVERASRQVFYRLGVLSRHEAEVPSSEEDRVISVFYGRVATRADFWCLMGDRLPGSSGSKVAEQVFATVPPDLEDHPTKRYYARVAARMPFFLMGVPRAARRGRAESEALWHGEVARIAAADVEEAGHRFTAAVDRFHDSLRWQAAAVMAVVQPIYDQLTRLVATVDGSGAELMGGYGDHEEVRMVDDLWACSRDRMDMATFLSRHGFHGPREGEISAMVWREDASPLERILEGYRVRRDESGPLVGQAARAEERQRAESRLLTALKGTERARARATLALARRYIPLRCVGKVAFLQNLDMARAAARRLGVLLADRGVLADPDDVFFLTAEEVSGRRWDAAAELVTFRRERHKNYETLELPVAWKGMPSPRPGTANDGVTSRLLEGTGASGGVAEGRVRVVHHAGEVVMDPGDILVSYTTDPSWASVLFLSSALVTDVGGPLSHAAVVARELGIPCVVNTKVGTKVLRTGDLCRVDGSTGRIEVLDRAPRD